MVMDKYALYVPRLVRKRENFAAGHRACIGCGEALGGAARLQSARDNVLSQCHGVHGDRFQPVPYTA